ncbi:MAG: radical SAM protein [Nitrospirota bacterium]
MNRRLLEKAAALLAREKGTIYKDPGGRIRICLVYPNTYRVGMSNLGFQGIYGLLNSRDDVVCERAFLPDEKDLEEHRRTGTPVFSLESRRPLDQFDIVAFSVSFENDYPHLIRILDLSRIPFRTAARTRYHPLLIAGGACMSFNPEPLAPFLDVVFIGEAEEALGEFLDCYRRQADRDVLKRALLMLQGVYVPEFYDVAYDAEGRVARRSAQGGVPERVERRIQRDLSRMPMSTAVVTPEAEFSGMYLIEAMRGCPWSCRFCLVGHTYNPPRKKDIAAITGEIERAKDHAADTGEAARAGQTKAGQTRIGLIGPSLSDYPYAKEVLCMEGVEFSITSLRASAKSAGLVELLKRHKSVSIAPEAGTERMRSVIDKRITEQDILETAQLILTAGIETLRLYFMIGLPTETEEDVAGIAGLVKKIRALSARGSLVASISTFVPKPFTPFQWHPMEALDSVKRKMKTIKDAVKNERGIKVFHDVPKYAFMQGLFSRGSRRIAPVLEAMAHTDDWRAASAAAGISPEPCLFRARGFDEVLPWDFIDAGISKEKLWSAYNEALAGERIS